jgi:hypothetical protein
MTATPNLLYVYDNTGDDSVDFLPETDTLETVSPTTDGSDTGVDGVFNGLAIDAAAGVYFVTGRKGADTSIYEQKFGATTLSTTALVTQTSLSDAINSIALNASDDILYFTAGTGFYEETFSGANFSGTTSEVQLATLPTSTAGADDQLAFDQADHTAYFASPNYHVSRTTVKTAGGKSKNTTITKLTSNYVYVVSGVTATAGPNSLTSLPVQLGGPSGQLPFADGAITAIALDSATDTLLIATTAIANSSASSAGIYEYDIATKTLTTAFTESDPTGTMPLNDMTYITVDPTNGDYFVSDSVKAPSGDGIYEGNVANVATTANPDGVAPTLIEADGSKSAGDSTFALAIDPPPTVSSASVTAIDGSGSRTTGVVTTADTVTISVSFSENVTITGTPTLTLNDGGSATYASGSGAGALVFSYKPASGQNAATLASTGLTGGTIEDSAGTAANVANAAQTFTGLRVQTSAPTLSVTGETADVVQGAATATTLLSSGSITDPGGSGSITKATITIAGAKTGDELSISGLSGGKVDGNAITVSGNDTSTLTLSGSASLAEYQSLLANVTYQDLATDSTSGRTTRTFDWTVDDGVFASNTTTSAVTIDRAPSLTAGAQTIYQGGQTSSVGLDTNLSIADLDGSQIASATLTIAAGDLTGDTLLFATQNGISGTQSGNKLVLSGAASAVEYQTALQSIGYDFLPQSGDPTNGGVDTSRTLDWTVDDGVTSSAVATSTLNVVHTPPTLTVGGTVNYSEVGLPIAVDPGLMVSDSDSGGLLQGATVDITSGFTAGDVLGVNVTGTPGISVTQNSNGTLTLSGSDTLADYQAALRSVSFASTAPESTTTSRTLTWSVTDGVASSAAGETSTISVAPCYCRGARILTERGEVAVEHLRVGDIAITAAGRRRPIVWLGHRRLDLSRHPRPYAVHPVRVAAGAFGDNLPHRDLWLSPGHNVTSDGDLMPISSLINGCSVAQIARDRVEYWHVELDAHDILIAEGLAAESYLDCGNREAFDNGGAFVEAHPDFQSKHWAQTCLPLVTAGPQVQAMRAKLIGRLFEQGYALDTRDGAHVLVDGLRVEPVRIGERRLAFALPAGGVEIALASDTFVPAHALADGDDWRELGICVGRLQIDGDTLSLETGEAVASGWHAAEFEHGRFARRWTRGAAPLPAGARFVVVDLAEFGQYWREPAHEGAVSLAPKHFAI